MYPVLHFADFLSQTKITKEPFETAHLSFRPVVFPEEVQASRCPQSGYVRGPVDPKQMPLIPRCSTDKQSAICIDVVTLANHPFGNSLYRLFMVKLGIFDYCFNMFQQHYPYPSVSLRLRQGHLGSEIFMRGYEAVQMLLSHGLIRRCHRLSLQQPHSIREK